MSTDLPGFKYNDLPEKIIRVFYQVYNTFFYRLLEKASNNVLFVELASRPSRPIPTGSLQKHFLSIPVGESIRKAYRESPIRARR